ncbi:unnamed protein product [Callosobruchus maculatus]|nr:unnamed protein product [Callosobruchus maculatus]
MLNVSPEKYYRDLTLYLQSDSNNLSYKIDGNEFILYYKPGSNIKIKYFCHSLNKVDYFSTVHALLDKFFNDRTLYQSKATNLQHQNITLEKDKAVLKEKLQELVKRKQEEEENIYSSFVLVLNEKKRQIQHLNELLEAFRQGRPTLNPPISSRNKKKIGNKQSRKTKPDVKNEVSESDNSANEYNTDEENSGKIDTVSKEINIQPSTSKHSLDLQNSDEEESCLLPKMDKQINFSLLDSDEDDKLSFPKKKKICYGKEKENDTPKEPGQMNDKCLNYADNRHSSSIKVEVSERSDNMSSFVIHTSLEQECNFDNEVKGGTDAFTTVSNNSVLRSPSMINTVKEDLCETSVTYDTEELLDRI